MRYIVRPEDICDESVGVEISNIRSVWTGRYTITGITTYRCLGAKNGDCDELCRNEIPRFLHELIGVFLKNRVILGYNVSYEELQLDYRKRCLGCDEMQPKKNKKLQTRIKF